MAPYKKYQSDFHIDFTWEDEEFEAEICDCCGKEPAESNGICKKCNAYMADFLAEYRMLPDFIRNYVVDNLDNWG